MTRTFSFPLAVGHVGLNTETSAAYSQLLLPFLQDPHTFIIVSSDFCHWGKRFNYTHYDMSDGPVFNSIMALDKSGMRAIQSLQISTFAKYIKDTKNTICGRHPIGLLLTAVAASTENTISSSLRFIFTRYTQSSRCTNCVRDSSVSYAAGVLCAAPSISIKDQAEQTMRLPLYIAAEHSDDADLQDVE